MKIKTKCICCKKVRIVEPLFKPTPKEIRDFKTKYVCSDCNGKTVDNITFKS